MSEKPTQELIQQGTWLYDGCAERPVYVIRQNYDYLYEMEKVDGEISSEDRPRLSHGVIYYVRLRKIDGSSPWGVDSFGHDTLDEAKQWAVTTVGQPIQWRE